MILARVRYIFETEGVTSLLRRVFIYVITYLPRRLFQHETYFLYEHTLTKRNEADFMPKIQNFACHIVFTNQQIGELVKDGFDDIRRYGFHARRRLDKGAIAFCIFIGPDLANIGWIATTKDAKSGCDPLPYRVDFSNDQACTGGTFTIEKYRGKGLMAYGYYKRLEFLRERGFKISRNAVAFKNIASQKVHAKFKPKIYAKASYLKILWWRSWRETPHNRNRS
jgi:hypothetical protein